MTTSTANSLTLATRATRLFGSLLLAGLSTTGISRAASVRIDNFTFTPAVVTITPGETVTWTNADDIPHTVVAADHTYRSKPLDSNDTFAHDFASAGEYSYFCSLHPHMTGKIIVKAR